jgi:hypothetical protein
VVADCTLALRWHLSVRPSGITLACADDGLGIGQVNWSQWTAAGASGRGTFWDKLCVPSCASGAIASFPALVRLSDVQSSAQGPWFKTLTVTWLAGPPSNTPPTSYALLPPQAKS